MKQASKLARVHSAVMTSMLLVSFALIRWKAAHSYYPALVEQFWDWRRSTISRRKRPVSAATVNREIACLKRMINVAHKGLIVLKSGIPKDKPLEVVSLERERNERGRVLSAEEFTRPCEAAEDWLKPMLVVAYCTGMGKGEIRSLRWDQVDLKTGTIGLKWSDAKTDEGRVIRMSQTLTSTLKTATRYMHCPWVFVNPARMDARQTSPNMVELRYHKISISHAFARACQKAGVKNACLP